MTVAIPSPAIVLDRVSFLRPEMPRPVLEPFSLTINRGDMLVITGPNGGGKTTLLRLMLRLLSPSGGTVSYLNPDGTAARHLNISYLPQNSSIDSRFPMTVTDAVSSGLLGVKGLDRRRREAMTAAALAALGLEEVASHAIGRISGGQLQRTLLARAIVSKPEMLMLDEPMSYLDAENRRRVSSLICAMSPATTIIVVSHESTGLDAIATRRITVDHRVAVDCPAVK